jgi:Icc-related predicted phosphoesterase
MKLVFISDTHGYLRERDIPEGDVLVHCGDACSSGQRFEFINFCEQMEKIAKRFRLTLYTPGNHDRFVEVEQRDARREFDSNFDNFPLMQMLIHESFEFEGIKFFGSPYTPEFYNWAFMYPRDKGKEIWANVPDDTDVLFTHGMPHGVLDRVGRLIGKDEDEHVGCVDLRKRIAEIKPKVFAGGHLHLEGGQQIEQDGTVFINAAICDDSYTPSRKAIEIEI